MTGQSRQARQTTGDKRSSLSPEAFSAPDGMSTPEQELEQEAGGLSTDELSAIKATTTQYAQRLIDGGESISAALDAAAGEAGLMAAQIMINRQSAGKPVEGHQ